MYFLKVIDLFGYRAGLHGVHKSFIGGICSIIFLIIVIGIVISRGAMRE